MDPTGTTYEIRVRGRIGPEVLHLLEDLEPTVGRGATLLRTSSHDQAALHGALTRLMNLGLEIEYVTTIRTP